MNRDYRKNIQQLLGLNIVPIMFVGLCLLGVRWSGKPPVFLLQEVVFRMSRNSFLVLSLVIPVMAGLGLSLIHI